MSAQRVSQVHRCVTTRKPGAQRSEDTVLLSSGQLGGGGEGLFFKQKPRRLWAGGGQAWGRRGVSPVLSLRVEVLILPSPGRGGAREAAGVRTSAGDARRAMRKSLLCKSLREGSGVLQNAKQPHQRRRSRERINTWTRSTGRKQASKGVVRAEVRAEGAGRRPLPLLPQMGSGLPRPTLSRPWAPRSHPRSRAPSQRAVVKPSPEVW